MPAYTRIERRTEKQFLADVKKLAETLGWMFYHPWLSIHSTAGFPDVVLVRGTRIIFAELKSESGVLSPAQTAWLDALQQCTGEVYVWRPADLDEIAHCLR